MPGRALDTDLYELNMAASYFSCGMKGTATFSCFVRRLPPSRAFLVAAGLEDVLEHLEHFGFDDSDLDTLRGIGFGDEAIADLAQLRFTGDVLAVPEGRIVTADEPLLEVTAPIAEAQLVETFVLNQLTYQTSFASKAARCSLAAGGRIELVEFGLRRAHGLEAGDAAARGAAIAGFAATSNVAAAGRYGLVAAGTMAHSYVEAFGSELEAFLAYGAQFGERSTFLVDTYDTLEGVGHAIEAIHELGLGESAAIRIDSGDLGELARASRRLLDEAGLARVRIFASGNLDEHGLAELVTTGAPVDSAGVGTRLAVSADAPYLESVYKLVAYEGRPVAKQSTGKANLPGAKQVFRRPGLHDTIALRDEPAPEGTEALLVPVMRSGRRITPAPAPAEALAAARQRCAADLAELPAAARHIDGFEPLAATISDALAELAEDVRAGRC